VLTLKFQDQKKKLNYLTSTFDRIPIPPVIEDGIEQNVAIIMLLPASFIRKKENEIRSNTILSLISAMGGAKSTAIDLFLLLFGGLMVNILNFKPFVKNQQGNIDTGDNEEKDNQQVAEVNINNANNQQGDNDTGGNDEGKETYIQVDNNEGRGK